MPSSLTNALTDMRTLIIAAVASEGNVGSKVFVYGGLKESTLPYVVIKDEDLSGKEFGTHDGGHAAERFDFSVHVHTKERTQGIQIRDLIINAIDGTRSTTGSTNFGSIHHEGGAHFFNEKLKTNEQIDDFTSIITNG